MLLEAGANVEAKSTDNECTRPLHVAVGSRICPSGTTCALLEGGANVNARDAFGCTPLHYAARRLENSNIDGVELRLRWGADETRMDEHRYTVTEVVGLWEDEDSDDDEDVFDEEQRKAAMTSAFAT